MSMQTVLEQFKIRRFKASYQWECEGRLPEYKGSTLRGTLGHVLRSLSCVNETQCKTNGCIEPNTCAYQVIFESPDEQSGFRPHPFVLRSADRRTEFREGDTLEVELLLFGDIGQYQDPLVESLKNIGKLGLGVSRHELKLIDIHIDTVSVLPGSTDDVIIEFVTPARIFHHGMLMKKLEFPLIVKSVFHRLKLIITQYYPELMNDLEQHLPVFSETFKKMDNLQLEQVYRYSNRQERKMRLDGLVGIQRYTGPGVREALPLLRAGELIHLGKSTSMGFGQIKIWT